LAAEVIPAAAEPAALVAFFAWRVEAAFLPVDWAFVLAWLRFLVAAPFWAAALRSAFV
jgi:hypothetical protein